MGSGARSSSPVEGPKVSGTLARMLGRLTGAFALVLGAGTLLTLVGASAPATAAGNVTPSIYIPNYQDNNNLTFPLTASGDVAPAVTTTSFGTGNPSGEAFDGHGNLWVANFNAGPSSVPRC